MATMETTRPATVVPTEMPRPSNSSGNVLDGAVEIIKCIEHSEHG